MIAIGLIPVLLFSTSVVTLIPAVMADLALAPTGFSVALMLMPSEF